jgi:hypothetical protein
MKEMNGKSANPNSIDFIVLFGTSLLVLIVKTCHASALNLAWFFLAYVVTGKIAVTLMCFIDEDE